MAIVAPTFTNPWGRSSPGAISGASSILTPARSDLWQLDLSSPIKKFKNLLPAAYAYDQDVNNSSVYSSILAAFPTPTTAAYLARSVQFPNRLTGVGATTRRDNAPFAPPGYQEPLGPLQVVFAHELAQNYAGSAIWSLLTVWRAFARAGYGPDFPGTQDLYFSLLGAAGGGSSLVPPYRQDIRLTLLTPATGDGTNASSLNLNSTYVAANAWPVEFGLVEMTYEGSKILELHASFRCDDVRSSN